jgi:hypothetical protein
VARIVVGKASAFKILSGPVKEYQTSLMMATAAKAGVPDGNSTSMKNPDPMKNAAKATKVLFPIQGELINTDSNNIEGKSIRNVTTMKAAGESTCSDPPAGASSRAANRGNMYANAKETKRVEISSVLKISTGRRNIQRARVTPPAEEKLPALLLFGSSVALNFSTAL